MVKPSSKIILRLYTIPQKEFGTIVSANKILLTSACACGLDPAVWSLIGAFEKETLRFEIGEPSSKSTKGTPITTPALSEALKQKRHARKSEAESE